MYEFIELVYIYKRQKSIFFFYFFCSLQIYSFKSLFFILLVIKVQQINVNKMLC